MVFSFGSRGSSQPQRRSRKTKSRRNTLSRTSSCRRIALEPLEERALLNATMEYQHVIYDPSSGQGVPSALISTPLGSATPPSTAFTPAQIRKAYGIDQIFDKGVAADGTGMTVAIIDAYDNPKFISRSTTLPLEQDTAYLASDLHQFCLQYGLPETAGFFTKVNQTGGTTYPSGDSGWGTEIALDVEWVHAIAPGAKIVLVEANSAYDSDLINVAAVWARDHSGAVAISMSFGRSESSSDTSLNTIFQSPADHGLTWLASTGDNGQPSGYPAFSPNVVAVGGTTLTAPAGVYNAEVGWGGSGGSISSYQSQPTYQQGLVLHNGTSTINANGKRSNPDVSFDADPNTGVAVYDSYVNGSTYPWIQVGGTSFSSPAWAGLVAIIDQIRTNHGLASLDGSTGFLPSLYQTKLAIDYHDVTSGSNGYSAGAGYDLVTGLGTPKADKLLLDLSGVDLPPTVVGTAPALADGVLDVGSTSLAVNFSEILLTGADNPANYQLQKSGEDGLLGTGDDISNPLSVVYNGTSATLTFSALSEEVYRLTVRDAITDMDGNKLDGNTDGNAGGDWTFDFVAAVNPMLRFEPVKTINSGGTGPYKMTGGDFNADGKLDLAVENINNRTLAIQLGDGHGGFAPATSYSLANFSFGPGIVSGDYNDDGNIDLVVTNNSGSSSSGTSVGILLGNGKGNFFIPATVGSGGSYPYDVVTADFNGDGKLDLAVTNNGSSNVGILLGTGYGFLTPVTVSTGGSGPRCITLGDFNGDGKLDLAAVNNGSNTIGVMLGNGSGGFAAATAYFTGGSSSTGITAGDFNGDGKLDLAVTNSSSATVSVFLGNGNGTFAAATTYTTGGASPMYITAADINLDGKLDLAVTNSASASVGILLGNGSGGFASGVAFPSGGDATTDIVQGDFDSDGLTDLAVSNLYSNTTGVLLNDSNSSYITKYSPHGLPFEISTGGFGTGEVIQGLNNAFDGDGRLFIGSTPFQPAAETYSTADANQTVITSSGTAAGLTIRREFTVPNKGNEDFLRTMDVFTNDTGAPITTTVRIVGNLGSNWKTAVFATSDGLSNISPDNLWFGTDDNVNGGGTPAVIHYIRGLGAMKPDSVSCLGDNLEWTYTITVPAGQSVRLAYFTIVAMDRAAAISAANALVTPTGFGGQAAAFLDASELQSLVNFVNLNHAPALAPAAPVLGSTDEETLFTVQLDAFINHGAGSTTISDADAADPLGGIAITGLTGHGTWYYSAYGASCVPIGAVSESSALLLPASGLLHYIPDSMNGEMPTITYRAWDWSFGPQGGKADASVNGGATAFSTTTDTATLVVTSLNDAPVLTAAAPSLGSASASGPATFDFSSQVINHGAGTTIVTDVDAAATIGGIAVVGTTGQGDWSYSLDGTNFLPIGNVSEGAALLVPKAARIRFTPDGAHSGMASLKYRAWDETTSAPETIADTTVNGGATAFSVATDTAWLLINDAPVLNPASPAMGATNEDTAITIDLANTFINHGAGTTVITDVNTADTTGGIALAGISGRGAWSYSLDGTTFVALGTVSEASSLLLPATAKLRYMPDQKNGEAPTIIYRAWDATSGSAGTQVNTAINGGSTAFSTDLDTAVLTVTDINDAPVLTSTSQSQGYKNTKSPIAINLSALINNGTGTTTVTDVDNGSILGGIALAATSGHGVWTYSLDGVNYAPVGMVSSTAALLLPATAILVYTPDGVTSETVSITYRAWDQSSGTVGGVADITANGGSTAFSATADTASMIIDYTLPTILSTSPTVGGGTLAAGTSSLAITFSESMLGLGTAANYQLQTPGTDGLLGTADDEIVPLAVSTSGNKATLTFSQLKQNLYRLTAFDSLTDLAGNKLDGNGDGLPGGNWTADFVVVPSATNFPGVSTYAAGGTNTHGIGTGDFNGDGIRDLVVTNRGSGNVGVFLSDAKGGFSAVAAYSSGGSSPISVSTGDFNRDGKLDLAVANNGSGTIGILLGNGTGGFSSATTYNAGGGQPNGIVVADFNGDGKLDLATTNWASGTVGILLGNGTGSFSTSTVSPGGDWPDDIAAGDFNGDGKIDLAVANGFSDTVGILLGSGTGGFSLASTFGSGVGWTQGITMGDFNGDGKTDIATSGVSTSKIGIFLGNGSGSFTAGTALTTGYGPQGMAVGDFNGDGKTDLAAAYGSGAGVFYGNGNGTFAAAAVVYSSGGSSPAEVAAADFDGDGKLDLAVTNSGGNSLGVMLNLADAPPVTLNSFAGRPFDISVGAFGAGEINQGYNNAFDGDGRLFVSGKAFKASQSGSTSADSGQTVVTATGTAAGLTVNRRITVPNTGNEDFARTVDVFTNSTAGPITTTVRIVGNLGADAKTMVFGTSDGTGVASPNCLWIGTDDNLDGSGTPAVIHYIRGPGAIKPDAVSIVGDNIQWTYTITVAAGQTVELAYFTIVAATRTVAVASANLLVLPGGFGGQAGSYLTPADLQSMVNFINLNHAPVLTPAAPNLGITDEETAVSFRLADLLVNHGPRTTTITDPDANDPVGGIALTGFSSRGAWFYSLDDTTYSVAGQVSDAAALLLPASAWLRYVPDSLSGETATITYRAWDQTYGTPGMKVNALAFGGAATYSAVTDTAALTVTDLNESPVLTPASPSMGGTTKDTLFNIDLSGTFINNGAGTTTITDVDQNAIVGGIAIIGTTGYGAWSYSLDGINFSSIGIAAVDSGLLLPRSAILQYLPDGVHGETATITYRAWDDSAGTAGTYADTTVNSNGTPFSSAFDTASLLVNTSPVLTPASPSMGSTDENTSITTALSTFINQGPQTTVIADADPGAILGGISLTATTGRGVWSYSLDGAVFIPVGTVSSVAALLLPSTAQLLYTPGGISGEIATIAYRAWDMTAGTAGSRFNASLNGGGLSISAAEDTASLTVAEVNDAPILTPASPSLGKTTSKVDIVIALSGTFINHGTGTTKITDVDSANAVGGIALTSATGLGVWSYSLDGTTFLPVGNVSDNSALLLPPTAKLSYKPNGIDSETPTLAYRAWDGSQGTAGTTLDASVNGGITAFSSAADTASLILDYTLPTIVSTTSSLAGGVMSVGTITMTVQFSEALLNGGTSGTSYYRLQSSGADGLLGTADDANVSLTIGYSGTTTTLNFSPLAENVYRLTIGDLLTDNVGNKLDGNRDGIAGGSYIEDIAVINASSFASPVSISAGVSTPWKIAKGDFNGDGNLDLAVSGNGSSKVAVMFGNGSGGFPTVASFNSGGSQPKGITAADFNGDGKLDIAVTNYYYDNVGILLGNGTGGFSNVTTYSTGGAMPQNVVSGDFNGDGKLDLAVTNWATATVGILLGNGAGGFGVATTFAPGGGYAFGVATTDFNGDGKLDLAVVNNDQIGTIGILLGSGTGTFTRTALLSSGGVWPEDIVLGDFNGDAKTDLAVHNNSGQTFEILLGDGNANFTALPAFPSGGLAPRNIAAADINGDGKLDLVLPSAYNAPVGVLYGQGDGTFGPYMAATNTNNGDMAGVAVGDFNKDGKIDLALTSYSGSSVSIFTNTGTPSWLTLNSSHGMPFDIAARTASAGVLISRPSGAFDYDGRLRINSSYFQSSQPTYMTADDRQTLVTSSATYSGLTVTRRVTVPGTGGEDFARTVDVFTNPGTSSITATVRIIGNLGSDAATTLFATSSGDVVLTPDDYWFGTDAGGSGTAVIHCFRSFYGLKPTAVSVIGDNVTWTFSLTVPAGQTRELGYFTIQAATRTEAINQVNALMDGNGFLDTAALGLSASDLASLANFQFDHAPTDINLSNASVPEDQAGAVVGTLTTIDPDQSGSYAYTITSDPTGKFEIIGNTLKLKNGAKFDFESLADPHFTLSIRTTDTPGGLSFEKQFTVTVTDATEPLVVLPSDLPAEGAANMTMTLAADGKLHIFLTGTATDIVPPHVLASVTGIEITGRNTSNVLTVESTGTGILYLTITNATLTISQDNAISIGMNITVDSGVLNFNGYFNPIGNLIVKNGGQATTMAINNTTTTVESGTLTVASIICDTLTIGSAPDAPANAIAINATKDTATQREIIERDLPPSATASNKPTATTSIDISAIVEQPPANQPSEESALSNPVASVPLVAGYSQFAPSAISIIVQTILTSKFVAPAGLSMQTEQPNNETVLAEPLPKELLSGVLHSSNRITTRFDHQYSFSSPSLSTERLQDSVYGELADSPAILKKPSISLTANQYVHRFALQSLVRDFDKNIAIDQLDSGLFVGKYSQRQDKLTKKAVDEFHANLVGEQTHRI